MSNDIQACPAPAFEELVKAFIAPYAPRGQSNKRMYLRHFQGWCQAEGIDPVTAARQDLDRWRGTLVASGRMPRSINAALCVVRTFSRWMVEEGYWETDPSRYMRNLPAPTQITLAWLTDEQTGMLLDYADQEADPTMRGIVYLLAFHGVRPQEARGLDCRDLDLDGTTIIFRGRKDGRTNRFKMPPEVLTALKPLVTRPTAPLFINEHTGQRISKCVAQKRFNCLVQGSGVPKITMYGLRASFATNALAAGVSLHDLQDAMGHSSPHMTAQYDQARREWASVAQLAAAERIRQLRQAA